MSSNTLRWTFFLILSVCLFAAAPAEEATPAELVPGEVVATPRTPAYPPLALAVGIEGQAEFIVHVDAAGSVQRVEIDKLPGDDFFGGSSWPPDVRASLESAITEAVMTWRYTPATRGGEPEAHSYRHAWKYRADLSPDLARMLPVTSEQAFTAMVELIDEIGIGIDEKDEQLGVLVCDRERMSDRRYPGLVQQAGQIQSSRMRSTADGFAVKDDASEVNRFTYHVFVSPWVEPAHVYVNAYLEGKTGAVWAHLGKAESWLLDRLEEKLGVKGEAISLNPVKHARNAAAAFDTIPDGQATDAARERLPSESWGRLLTADEKGKAPRRIEMTAVDPIFPGSRILRGYKGEVQVSVVIHESGCLVPLEVEGAKGSGGYGRTDDGALRALAPSALQAVRFWRYEPCRRGDEPARCWSGAGFTFQGY